MPYQITVRAGHVSEGFRRGGVGFKKGSPVVLESLNNALKEEQALGERSALRFEEVSAEVARRDVAAEIIEALGSESAEDAKADLGTKKVGELRDLAARVGVELPDNVDRKTLLEALRGRL